MSKLKVVSVIMVTMIMTVTLSGCMGTNVEIKKGEARGVLDDFKLMEKKDYEGEKKYQDIKIILRGNSSVETLRVERVYESFDWYGYIEYYKGKEVSIFYNHHIVSGDLIRNYKGITRIECYDCINNSL